MPISHKHKVLFIHIPKCAGTTVEQILDMSSISNFFSTSFPEEIILKYLSFDNFSEDEKRICLSKNMQHYTYQELVKLLPQTVFNDYYKFSIVRNPYSRIVSEFLYRIERTKRNRKGYFYNFSTFKEFIFSELGAGITKEQRIEKYDAHLETQKSFLINAQGDISGLDKIYKMEINLNECLDLLKLKTDLNLNVHARKGVYDRTIAEFYDADTKEIVYNFYKEDFELFNYSSNL